MVIIDLFWINNKGNLNIYFGKFKFVIIFGNPLKLMKEKRINWNIREYFRLFQNKKEYTLLSNNQNSDKKNLIKTSKKFISCNLVPKLSILFLCIKTK